MVEQQLGAIAQQLAAMQEQLSMVSQENRILREESQRREAQDAQRAAADAQRDAAWREELTRATQEAASLVTAAQSRQTGGAHSSGGGGDPALVSKWAPDSFSGKEEDWKVWSLKFRSYVGAMAKGTVGTWMDWAKDHRNDLDVSFKTTTLEPAAKAPSAILYSSLIATCEGRAMALVEKAGDGEGLEAWKNLLTRYDAQTRQSKVMLKIQVLSWDFRTGDLMDSLEAFDRACRRYTEATGKDVDDDTKIGVVIKGLETGALREHLLLHSERCETYEEFRDEIDTIAKARNSNLLTATPMDLGAVGRFEGNCNNCGKPGHKRADCWAEGGGAHQKGGKGGGKGGKYGGGKGPKGSQQRSQSSASRRSNDGGKGGKHDGKECYKCGGKSHIAKDCRASEAKILPELQGSRASFQDARRDSLKTEQTPRPKFVRIHLMPYP